MRYFAAFVLAIGLMPLSGKAQYVINDPDFLDKLLDAVPNAISGNVLDTLHPDVIALTVLDANGSYSIDGIRFFVNLEVLGLNYGYEDTLTDLPNTLRTIHLDFSETRIRYVDHWPDSLREPSIRNDWYWNPTAGLQSIDVIDTLPPYLEYLDLYGHYLDTLPALPSTLRHLDVQRNQAVTSLPALPNELRHMNVSQTDIPALPVLPDSLIYLSCGSNLHLAVLGPLPAGLKELHVTTVVPLLPDLPALPPTLEVLEYGGATLGSIIPPLPSTLRELLLNNLANVTSIPALPAGLERLQATYMNNVPQLPPLPSSLTYLNTENTLFDCYPYVPSSVTEWKVSATTTCIPNLPPNLNAASNADDFPICNLINTPDCPTTEGVTGHVFRDDNANGTRDPGEPPFPLAQVIGTPGTHLAGADNDGRYMLALDTGAFVVDGTNVLYYNHTTAPYAITISTPLQVDSLIDIGYAPIPGTTDVRVDLTSNLARPGFPHTVWCTLTHQGTSPTDATLELTYEPAFTYTSASTVPASIVGNTLSWSFTNLLPGSSVQVQVHLYVPANTPIGTPGLHAAAATIPGSDPTPADNAAQLPFVVFGSYDPNDKLVDPPTMDVPELLAGTPLTYTIRFQNTGTYLAERVVITDTLPPGLVQDSLHFIGSSHSCSWYLDDGVLNIVFEDIMLPDSTSDEPGSHGYAKFRIAPVTGLLPGETVTNIANIYFDFNAPVITPPSVFAVEVQTAVEGKDAGELWLAPNPVDDLLQLRLAFSVEDADVRVLDAAGRMIYQATMNGPALTLDTDGWHAGVYAVQVRTTTDLWTAHVVKR
ncbi:MAG: T9SS type A sorting domain-containing protein [Flavobacteriales bacterium]|nr:T9SS type A sorting domain-containing protein [Flavobacteriales bacterium]